MSCKIRYTALFEKEAKRLLKKYPSLRNDIGKLIDSLEMNPKFGTPLGKNLFKIRLAIESKGSGKSGGTRVITYVLFSANTVYLTSIYDKSEQSNISTITLIKILKEEGIM